jgi:hypothetical protein
VNARQASGNFDSTSHTASASRNTHKPSASRYTGQQSLNVQVDREVEVEVEIDPHQHETADHRYTVKWAEAELSSEGEKSPYSEKDGGMELARYA